MTNVTNQKRGMGKNPYPKGWRKPKSRSLLQPNIVHGLPKADKDSLVSISRTGEKIWLVKGKKAHRYALHHSEGKVRAELESTLELPDIARKLSTAPDGAVFVLLNCQDDQTLLVQLEADKIRTVHHLSTVPTAIVATRNAIGLSVKGDDLNPPQLLVLNRADGRITRRLPLNSANVRLRSGRNNEILLSEKGSRKLRYLNATYQPDECAPPPGNPNPPSETPGRPNPRDKDCCCHSTPPNHGGDTGGNGRRPSRPRNPHDHCVPGDDGVPDDCIVTYTFGVMIITVNICDPGQQPCSSTLNWPPASIHRTRNSVVATSADGRRVAILDAKSLRALYEFRSMRQPVSVMVAADADLVFLQNTEGQLSLLDPAPVLPALAPGLGLVAKVNVAMHSGSSPAVQYSSGGIQVGVRNVLIVPVLEPGQGFTGNTNEFSDYYEMQDILEKVQAFYIESTYDQQPDHYGLTMNFIWFGANTPELYTGSPVVIDKMLKEYWGRPGIQGISGLPSTFPAAVLY